MGISMDNRLKECVVVTKDTALGYTHRVIVAGSRKYNDYAFFKSFMKEYFIDDPLYTNNLCFISAVSLVTTTHSFRRLSMLIPMQYYYCAILNHK
jgi:hypothetical protein